MKILKRLTYQNLKLNRKRSIVTVVGIVLSVALITALASLVSSFRNSLIEYQKAQQGNYHYQFTEVDEQELVTIRNNRRFETVVATYEIGYATLKDSKNEGKPYAYIMQIAPEDFQTMCFQLVEGRAAENENEVVIPRHLKTNGRVDYKVGDTITLEVGTRKDASGEYELNQMNPFSNEEMLSDTVSKTFTVVGIMERPGKGVEPFSAPGYTFCIGGSRGSNHITAYCRFDLQHLGDRYATIANLIGVDPVLYTKLYTSNMSEAEADTLLGQMEHATMDVYENFYLIMYENPNWADNTLRVILFLACIVAVIIIVTSVYCIKNSFEISVSEKVRQYGMLSSVGSTRRQIRGMVYYEAFLLGIIGIPLGVGFGVGAAIILVRLTNYLLRDSMSIVLVFSTSWISILIAVVLGTVTIFLSAARSAGKASRITPIQAIRSQDSIKIKAKEVRMPRWIRKLFGVGGMVSYKNIKRNRKKYRTSVTSITICTIVFIVTSYFVSIGFSLLGASMTDYDYDLSVYLRDNSETEQKIVESIIGMDGVTQYAYYEYVDDVCLEAPDSEAYKKYFDNAEFDIHDYVNLIIASDNEYERFLKENGLSAKDMENKVILMDFHIKPFYDEEIQDQRKVEYHRTAVSAGDTIGLYTYDFENTKKDLMQVPVGAVVNAGPMGYFNAIYSDGEIVVVNRSTFDALGLSQLKQENVGSVGIYFRSSDTDRLQDDVEKIMEEMGYSRYSIYNVAANARATHSAWLLVSIFAYGLLIVIALIGVTSIVNTINTGMELRSREFATLRSVGMTTREFNRMIRLESFFIGSKALVIGIPIGFGLSVLLWWLESTYDMKFGFEPPIPAILICIVVVFALLFLIMKLAMTKINRKNIIETIKNENM